MTLWKCLVFLGISYFLFQLQTLQAAGWELPCLYADEKLSPLTDTLPSKDGKGGINEGTRNPFDLKDPKVIDKNIEFDTETGEYKVTEKVGNDYYRPPTNMTFAEFMNFKARQQDREYFKNLAGISTEKRNFQKPIDPISKIDLNKNLSDRLFGGLGVEINPKGSIEMRLGANYNFTDNPIIPTNIRGQVVPDFDMDIQMDVQGNIGDKLNLNTNYNTGATFDFENRLKLNYDSEKFSEDDIIKKVEAGNVSLPLRSNLIQGSQNLLGIKTDWQFGYLRLTGLVAQQRSKQEKIQIKGGGVVQNFSIRPDQYDENRHFFLSHYNREAYEDALSNLPEINSPFKIKNIEVWVTEDQPNSRETQFRDIVALTDLGATKLEHMDMGPDGERFLKGGRPVRAGKGDRLLPTNDANTLMKELQANEELRELNKVVRFLSDPAGLNLKQGRDFEKVRAKRLSPSEYSYNAELGFISLRVRPRPNQVVAVAYQYLFNGREKDPKTGIVYKVGELSSEVLSDSVAFKVVFVKMLKSSTQVTNLPSFDLMMKNVYPTGGFNLNPEDFQFDIFFEDNDLKPKRYIDEKEGYPLLNLFKLDNLNRTNDAQPDGLFDFIPGQTVIPSIGAIIFPVVEPFGKSFEKLVTPLIADPVLREKVIKKYSYPQLYDTSITSAQRNLNANQFIMRGSYKSGKSNEISLNTFNLNPNTKVTVRAGSAILNEGSDYMVDRNLGRVTILNESYLNSGVPIEVGYEDNALFNFQTKTMFGFRAEYVKHKDLSLGATYMHLFERPFTQKVNLGEDPINNRIYGLDFSINKKAPWMTRILDKLPLYFTKEPSFINFQAEAAVIDPGHSRAINQEGGEGAVYIDDFEGAASGIGLYFNVTQWVPASLPTGLDDPVFMGGLGNQIINHRIANANRARLAWYRIDELARVGAKNPNSVYTKAVFETDVFPNRARPQGFNQQITFDITYFPNERAAYNFDVPGGLELNGYRTAGIDENGKLLNPASRWAGIMTRLNTNDFEQSNVEYIDFWMLNPFIGSKQAGGKIYLQLGTFSEDILRDGKQQFENGLPTPTNALPTDRSTWGIVSRVPPLNSYFDVDGRSMQDVGLDGLNSLDPNSPKTELSFYQEYLNEVRSLPAWSEISKDPANDDYVSFADPSFTPNQFTVIEKYKKFNNPEGNAQLQENLQAFQASAYTGQPDMEDLNNDKSLNELESYYHYEVELKRSGDTILYDLTDFNNVITDRRDNGNNEIWYRFRIPIAKYKKKVGSQQDFRSIQSMRILFTGFEEQTTFRFIEFQLGRNTWRRFDAGCGDAGVNTLIIDKVDIEQNASKLPFNYIVPPGIVREQFFSNQFTDVPQNEASLLIRTDNLSQKCELSVYKIIDLDIRRYKNLKMFVHGEAIKAYDKKNVYVFMRLCRDFNSNYYEYEVPLSYSNPDFPRSVDSIWLDRNSIEFPLDLLVELKNRRNELNIPPDSLYSIYDPNPKKGANRVSIIGNPTLGMVRAIQIGIRNKSDEVIEDAEIWVNELRLTGLSEQGGFAAQARAEFQLADLGNLALSGNYSSIGWGGIDQRVEQRSLEEVLQLDLTTNLSLDKFLPKTWGLRLPFAAQISYANNAPKFDPIDTDLNLKEKLERAATKQARDSIREQATTQTNIKSFSFNNVRKERTGQGKPKPWNVENFSLSYNQSVSDKSTPIIRSDQLKTQQGSIDYNFSWQPKYIEPLKKIVKSKYLKLLSEFNFNPVPNSFSVRNNLDRKKGSKEYRFADPRYSRWEEIKFNWYRDYALNWDLTKSLKLNFSAKNDAAVDEMTYNPLRGEYVNPQTNLAARASERKQFLRKNLVGFGRNRDYKHTVNLSYNAPFRHIPLMDFVSARAQYTANYGWASGSLRTIDSLGSVISNGQNINISGELNLTTLYNKSKYLKQVSGERAPANTNRFRPSAKPKDDPSEENPEDDKGKKGKKDKKNSSQRRLTIAEKVLIRPLLLLKRVQVSYTQNKATVIPGFMNRSEILGMDKTFTAPGWDFVAGFQPDFREGAWLDRAAARGWISSNCFFNREMTQQNSNTLGAKMRLEPFKDFNIDANLDRSFTRDRNESFRYDEVFGTPDSAFQHFTPNENGQYSISFFSAKTLFKNDPKALFEKFAQTREVISQRVGDKNGSYFQSPYNPAYRDGFNGDHIEVITAAFYAAYADKDPNTSVLDFTKLTPLPNWQVNYNGLTKLPALKNIFQDFSIRHAYKNTLTVSAYRTNLEYNENQNQTPISRKGNDLKASYHARYELPDMSINEQFSPLIGVNVKTKSGIELGFDYNKSRRLTLAPGLGGTLTENNSTNYTLKAGYIIRNLYLPWMPGIKKQPQKPASKKKRKKKEDPQDNVNRPKGNDLEMNFNFGLRDDIQYLHRLDAGVAERPVNGARVYNFDFTVRYGISKNLSARLFFDYRNSLPYASPVGKSININGGVAVTFTLE